MSAFAWLDISERDRRRTLDVIDLFQQKETVDELGIGSIRDAIADVLSPGTSTIQTRARYFFFVAWVYRGLERTSDSIKVADKARRVETALISGLLESEDLEGIIGRRAGASLQRLPSSVYWAGLGRLGFRLFTGSRDRYHRSLKHGRHQQHDVDTENPEPEIGSRSHWHPRMPAPPAGFPREISFELTPQEANFFLEQLDYRAAGSLLHFLARRGKLVMPLDKPWQYPELTEMPADLRRWLHDARCYSDLVHGAQLLYNLMLAELRDSAKWLKRYRDRLAEWARATDAGIEVYRNWQQGEFWRRVRTENPRLPNAAERFSQNWIARVLNARRASDLIKDDEARSLICDREGNLKGARARLQSPAHLEVWGGESGVAALDYRWSITRTIANDIIAGLRK